MKLILVEAVVLAFAMLVVAAFVFRSKGARGMLQKFRDAALLYVILIFLLGIVTYWRRVL